MFIFCGVVTSVSVGFQPRALSSVGISLVPRKPLPVWCREGGLMLLLVLLLLLLLVLVVLVILLVLLLVLVLLVLVLLVLVLVLWYWYWCWYCRYWY